MQIAAQMYTVREFVTDRAGFVSTLDKLQEIGYRAVQLSAVGAMGGSEPEVSVVEAKRLLDTHGIQCIATHRSWDDLVNHTESEIDFHKELGCDYIAVGSLPQPYQKQGVVGYREWLKLAVPLAVRLKEAGLRFGYHNHAFEFEVFGAKRESGYDVLITEGGPGLMLELDVYWAAHAGLNPVQVINRAQGRLPVVHIKDKEVVGNDSVMAPIGEGNLEWDAILPALEKAGTEWFCVEQDTCRRDPFDCLKSSFEFLARRSSH